MLHRRKNPRADDDSTFERRASKSAGSEGTESARQRYPHEERRSGVMMTPRQVASRRPPSFLEGSAVTLVAMAALAAVAVLFLAIGFSRPLQRSAPLANGSPNAVRFPIRRP